MRGFQEPVDSGYLVDERDVLSEGVQRGSGRLREVGAVKRIGVIQKLNPAHKRGHGASMQMAPLTGSARYSRSCTSQPTAILL